MIYRKNCQSQPGCEVVVSGVTALAVKLSLSRSFIRKPSGSNLSALMRPEALNFNQQSAAIRLLL